MKVNLILILSLACTLNAIAQKPIGYKAGVTSESNMKAIESLSPYTTAVGFDTRYQGVKGTTRLFDTLVASSVLVKGMKEYIRMESDIDVVTNALLFRRPPGGELMEIKSDKIAEVIFHGKDKDMIFKTTDGVVLDRKPDENKFYQVLMEGPYQFIRITDRKFVAADYQRAYSPDIRFDEFKSVKKYYIMGSDSVFHRVQLTGKSLKKLFPDKKALIDSNFDEKTAADPEADIISLLSKF